jgi:hypothetical protein
VCELAFDCKARANQTIEMEKARLNCGGDAVGSDCRRWRPT